MATAAVILALGLAGSGAALASPSLQLGVTAWDAQASGAASTSQGTVVDLQSELGMQRHWGSGVYFVWHHDLPFIPDVEFEYDHLFNDGDATLSKNVTWQGKTYLANAQVLSQAELRDGRAVIFWNPLDDSFVNLRLGLEARWLNFQVPLTGTVQQGGVTQTESASAGAVAVLPLGNVGLTLYLPGHVALNGEWSYIRLAGSYFSDYRAGVSYTFRSGVVLSAGWRVLHLHLDSSRFGVKGGLEFKGMYAGLGYAF